MFEMLDHNGPGHFGSSFALGFSEPNFVKKPTHPHQGRGSWRPNPRMRSQTSSRTRGTRSARSTMARWEGPRTPAGTRRWRGRRLRRCWMGSKLSIGYMRQPRRDPPLRVPLAPRGGSSNLHLGAGSGRSRAPGGCCSRRHQGPTESEGPQGRMVGEQGRHIWHG